MYPTQARKVEWADLSDDPPSYAEVEQVISEWTTGNVQIPTKMPQWTDPHYEERLYEAYTSTCAEMANIAENPRGVDVGTRIALL